MVIVKKTQLEMLSDRNYIIPLDEIGILNGTITTVRNLNKRYKNKDNTKTIYVHYLSDDEKLMDEVKTFVLNVMKSTEGMIIGKEEQIEKMRKKTYEDEFKKIKFKNIQIFDVNELTYNVTKHIYYTKHELISMEEIINFVHKDQLPVILVDDPVVKYYNWIVGDVIRVYEQYDIVPYISISYGVII